MVSKNLDVIQSIFLKLLKLVFYGTLGKVPPQTSANFQINATCNQVTELTYGYEILSELIRICDVATAWRK